MSDSGLTDLVVTTMIVNMISIVVYTFLIRSKNQLHREQMDRFVALMVETQESKLEVVSTELKAVSGKVKGTLTSLKQKHGEIASEAVNLFEGLEQKFLDMETDLRSEQKRSLQKSEGVHIEFSRKQLIIFQKSIKAFEDLQKTMQESYKVYAEKVAGNNQRLDGLLGKIENGILLYGKIEPTLVESYNTLEVMSDNTKALIADHEQNVLAIKNNMTDLLDEIKEMIEVKTLSMEADGETKLKDLALESGDAITTMIKEADLAIQDYMSSSVFEQQQELMTKMEDYHQKMDQSVLEVRAHFDTSVVELSSKLDDGVKAMKSKRGLFK